MLYELLHCRLYVAAVFRQSYRATRGPNNTTDVVGMATELAESLTWCLIATVVVSLLEILLESLLWWAYQRNLAIHRNEHDAHAVSRSQDHCNDADTKVVPLSVNYHFTRQCNYQCGFCFHTAKTSFVLPIDEAKHGLKLLKEAGKHYLPSLCIQPRRAGPHMHSLCAFARELESIRKTPRSRMRNSAIACISRRARQMER